MNGETQCTNTACSTWTSHPNGLSSHPNRTRPPSLSPQPKRDQDGYMGPPPGGRPPHPHTCTYLWGGGVRLPRTTPHHPHDPESHPHPHHGLATPELSPRLLLLLCPPLLTQVVSTTVGRTPSRPFSARCNAPACSLQFVHRRLGRASHEGCRGGRGWGGLCACDGPGGGSRGLCGPNPGGRLGWHRP